MKTLLKKINTVIVKLLFILAFATNAQAEEAPVFKVEILVFESLALKGWTEEYWPEDINPLDTENTIALKPLPKSQNMLNKQAAKMTGQKGYRILLHKSWLVKAVPKNKAKPILISASKGSQVDGSLTFYKSRFPHVKVNLELDRKIPYRVKEEFAIQQNITIEDLPEFWRFQIKESRKLKSNQLHYIDHPLFGALVQIQWQK